MENNVEEVRIPLSPESLKQLGASKEEVEKAEAEWNKKEEDSKNINVEEKKEEKVEKKVEEEKKEDKLKVETKRSLYEDVFKKKEDSNIDKVDDTKGLDDNERMEYEKMKAEKVYEAENKLYKEAMSSIPEDRRIEVDKALADLISSDKYDKYDKLSPDERALTLVALAEKIAFSNIEKGKTNEAQAKADTEKKNEEALREVKEVSNFTTPNAPQITRAEQIAKLEKLVENGDEQAMFKLLELQRGYDISSIR